MTSIGQTTDLKILPRAYGWHMKTLCLTITLLWASSSLPFQAIDINQASAEQIGLLPGVGKRLAENIVVARKKLGRMRSLEDLDGVAGMTTRKLEQIKEHVIFGVTKKNTKTTAATATLPLKKPMSDKPIADFSVLLARVFAVQGLERDADHTMASRARHAAWLPQFSAYVDTDHGELATKKNVHDPVVTRGGRDVGFGIKARFDLDRLIFNNDELEVAKLALKRQEKRDEILLTVRQHYFRYVKLAATPVSSDEKETTERLQLELLEITTILNAMSGGAFSNAEGFAVGASS